MAKVSFVLSLFTRLTDRQMDGLTDGFIVAILPCICSAVKTEANLVVSECTALSHYVTV